jgi:hypothetical protein
MTTVAKEPTGTNWENEMDRNEYVTEFVRLARMYRCNA